MVTREVVMFLAEYHVFKSIVDISKLCKTKPPEYTKCYSKFVEDNSLIA